APSRSASRADCPASAPAMVGDLPTRNVKQSISADRRSPTRSRSGVLCAFARGSARALCVGVGRLSAGSANLEVFEWRWSETFYCARARCGRRLDACDVDRVGGVGGRWFACAAVERLADSGRLHAAQSCMVRAHEKGVRCALRCERHSAGSDSMVFAVDVEDDLAFKDVDRLVRFWMTMQRGGLAVR